MNSNSLKTLSKLKRLLRPDEFTLEKSVREQPSDPLAREYLYGAYQQKAVLLATALDRSTLEEK